MVASSPYNIPIKQSANCMRLLCSVKVLRLVKEIYLRDINIMPAPSLILCVKPSLD